MQLQHQFTVPVGIDEAWSALLDPERVAPCLPGATLSRAEGGDFAGALKVRLGPISLLYKGIGTFTAIDDIAHCAVIDVSGKDSRGNGTATATVTAVLTEQGSATVVTVETDLKITGRPAQLGRGPISEAGGRILDQFAECLAVRLTGGAQTPSVPPHVNGDRSAESAAGERSARAFGGTAEETAATASRAEWRVTPAGVRRAGPVPPPEPAEPVDLLSTAGKPVLTHALPVLAALAAAAVVVHLVRRRVSASKS